MPQCTVENKESSTSPLLRKRNIDSLNEDQPTNNNNEPQKKYICTESRTRITPKILPSPTKKSTFCIYTRTPTSCEIVNKFSKTNIKQGTETTLYTIAITKYLSQPNPKGNPQQQIEKENIKTPNNNLQRSINNKESPCRRALGYLTSVASSELDSEQSTASAVFQSVENVSNLSGTQLRVKTLTKNTTPSNIATKKCFSYVFK